MEEPRTANVPVLAPGEVYVYSHGNGAIFLLSSDGRSRMLPLAEAVEVTRHCHATGHQVTVGWDETPIARHVVERITAEGVPITVYDAPRPPHTWGEGTDALMEAAAREADPILDDLIARGVDVDHRDDSGSTALHHAAARGSLHAIEALAAAGADLDPVNDRGLTPHMLARSTDAREAAQLLASLGADPEGHLETVRFGPSHYGVLYYWVLILVGAAATLSGFLWPLTVVDVLVILAVLALCALVTPPRAFWAGGVPRRLDGTTLVLRGVLGTRREVDLRDVTGAAVGGNPTRSGTFGARLLVLGHADGAPVTPRALRRLRIPPVEVEGVAAQIERAIVVPVGATKGDEVVVPVGNVLSGRGIVQSTSLRRQLAHARQQRDRGST